MGGLCELAAVAADVWKFTPGQNSRESEYLRRAERSGHGDGWPVDVS